MTLIEPTDPVEIAPDPDESPIGPHSVEIGPWRRRLVQFQRFAGGFMMLKGLTYWSSLLGIGDGTGSLFRNLPVNIQAATVFFAVIDLIAGVALWLASTWGAMLWLIAVAAQVLADMVVLAPSGFGVLLTILEVLLVAAYVILRFMVHTERNERR